MKCKNCKYIRDLTSFELGLRCINSKNSQIEGGVMIVESLNYFCDFYRERNIPDMFEWDESKNKSNIEKHEIPFQFVYKLILDEFLLQSVEIPQKWEKIDEEKLKELGVELNRGNLDPVRAKLIGCCYGKVLTAIYTFRGSANGDMKYRIISLRRSDTKERALYKKNKLK